MLSQLMTYGKFGNLFCGVEHTFVDGQEKLNTLVLKKKNDEFLIEKTFECNVIAELKGQLPKEQHLFLIINNDKILFKVLKGAYGTQKAIATAFPNLKIEDFYYEILQTDTHTFIAICRKDDVDLLIEQYTKNQINIIGFSLGNLISSQLSVYIKNSIVNSSNARIFFEENNISNIENSKVSSPANYIINDLELSNKYVLSLAGIISYYTNQETTNSNFKNLSKDLSDNFKHKRIFEVGLKAGLSIIFILLLVSFLFFSHYSTKIDILNNELETNKIYKNSFTKLTDEVDKKERLVTNFSLTSSRSSWYLDQLGKSIPQSLLLTQLNFQPLIKTIKEEKEIVIREYMITIKGKSSSSSDFSNWINELEQKDWVEKVIIQEYGSGKKTTTEFELQIEFNN